MNYFIIIFAVVFFILIFPFSVKAQAFMDLDDKKIYYSIKLFGISLYSGYTYFENGKLKESNFLGKTHELKFSDIDFEKGFPDIGISIFKYATFAKINIFCEVGKNQDAFTSVLGTGCMYMLLGMLVAKIKNASHVTDTSSYVVTKTDVDAFELSIDSIIKVSLFSIIVSIIKDISKKATKTNKKERTQNNV